MLPVSVVILAKYHSSAWSAVSERPNSHARFISNAPGRARDSFSNVPIRGHDHKTNKQLLDMS